MGHDISLFIISSHLHIGSIGSHAHVLEDAVLKSLTIFNASIQPLIPGQLLNIRVEDLNSDVLSLPEPFINEILVSGRCNVTDMNNDMNNIILYQNGFSVSRVNFTMAKISHFPDSWASMFYSTSQFSLKVSVDGWISEILPNMRIDLTNLTSSLVEFDMTCQYLSNPGEITLRPFSRNLTLVSSFDTIPDVTIDRTFMGDAQIIGLTYPEATPWATVTRSLTPLPENKQMILQSQSLTAVVSYVQSVSMTVYVSRSFYEL
jgi:hypothetical protein